MERFPAVLIGGPPHSGKSVLTYGLTQALRRRGVAHYVVRAAADGEGDWANEAAQALVRELRLKGDFGAKFTAFVCESILGRHLPLLVDVGGRPTREQERILDCCTHAILLTPDDRALARWQDLAHRHGLSVVAELTSRLEGRDQVRDQEPLLRGVITGLERGREPGGPTFEALVERLASVLAYEPEDLYRIHEGLCPAEIVIHLARLAQTLGVPFEGHRAKWSPSHLTRVLDYLPEAVPLGLYGRGPNWLYAAVALQAAPTAFYQFDSRLGWVHPLPLRMAHPRSPARLIFSHHSSADIDHLAVQIPAAYLDYDQLETLSAPPVPTGQGVVLSGKLPHWLYTSLALTYRTAPWMAIYQPQLECAPVVYSASQEYAVGDCLRRLPGMVQ